MPINNIVHEIFTKGANMNNRLENEIVINEVTIQDIEIMEDSIAASHTGMVCGRGCQGTICGLLCI